MLRRLAPLAALLLATSCDASPAPAAEDLALRACTAALGDRLGAPDDGAAATLMIGRREGGWLVRGLTQEVAGAPVRNYQCRLVDAGAGLPVLRHLRLCEAGPSPWGCPG